MVTALIVPFLYVRPVEAAVAFRSAATAVGTGTITLAKPAGMATGDFLIASIVSNDYTNTSMTAPSGWVLVRRAAGTYTNSPTMFTFVKIADTGDPSYTFGHTGAILTGGIVAYTGVDADYPIVNFISNQCNTATSCSTISQNVPIYKSMIVSLYAQTATSPSFTSGSGMTLRYQRFSTGTDRPAVAMQDVFQPDSGPTGAKTMSSSVSGRWVTTQLALRPASGQMNQSAYRWFNDQDASGDSEITSSTYAKQLTSADPNKDLQTYSIARSPDGSYAMVGTLYDPVASTMSIFLAKYDAQGTEIWKVEWGDALGLDHVMGTGITAISDGGYIVTGEATSGLEQRLVVARFTSTGSVAWVNAWSPPTYGDMVSGYSVTVLSDGNVVVGGSYGGGAGTMRMLLLKINMASGALMWQTSSNSLYMNVADVYATADGGFVALTTEDSANMRYSLIKYTTAGAVSWAQKDTTASDNLMGNAVIQTLDGGYAVTGETGSGDSFLNKHTSTGVLSWSRYINDFGGPGVDVVQSLDGGYVVAGDAGFSESRLAKLSQAGDLEWLKTSSYTDRFPSVAVASDGGYVVLGSHPATPDPIIFRYNANGDIQGCGAPDCTTISSSSGVLSSTVPATTVVSAAVVGTYTAVSGYSTSTPLITENILHGTQGMFTDVSTPMADTNTPALAPANSSIFRLRLLQHVSVYSIESGQKTYKLQYAQRGADGICDTSFTGETYADVSASTPIAFGDNPTTPDESVPKANANDPTHGSDTTVMQLYKKTNSVPVRTGIDVGQDGLWDFALRNNSAPPGAAYCFRMVNEDGSLLSAYSQIPELTTGPPPVLSIGFVDATDTEISNPTFAFSSSIINNNTYQTSTTTFGTSDQKIRVFNSLAANGWSVTLSPTDGPTALWKRDDNNAFYDFNDSGVAGNDSAIDTDTYGGQLSVNPTASNIASACSTTGISRGSSANFLENVVDSITLISATNAAPMGCNWDITGVDLTQLIPKRQYYGRYSMSMTVTVVQL